MPNFRFLLPTLDQLTHDQRVALVINKPLLVTGGPGSGKTVVSIYRMMKLLDHGENVLLFTFNRTLMAAIRGISQVQGFDQGIVNSFFDWYFQSTAGILRNDDGKAISKKLIDVAQRWERPLREVIVDEAQDLEPKILQGLGSLAPFVSCGADKDQNIRNHFGNNAEEEIFQILKTFEDPVHQVLMVNFRNSRQVFSFARALVPNNPRPLLVNVRHLPEGDLPEVHRNKSTNEQLNTILQICLNNRDSNIGVLVHRKDEVDEIKNYLINHGVNCSYYYNKMDNTDQISMENSLQSPFVTTLYSCKGLEFDIVILPFFDISDYFLLKGWIEPNLYFVAATRTRRQLFILCNHSPAIIRNLPVDLYRFDEPILPFNF